MRTATVLRRLFAHEPRSMYSLALWILRRRHGVRDGDHPAPYTGPQTATMYGFVFVSVVETVVLAVAVPWPLVHRITLVVDVYGVLLMLALHASCVTRPHVVGPDGSLRLRYGALADLRVPAALIGSVRVDRRFPDGRLVRTADDGTLDPIAGGQTTVTVELTGPWSSPGRSAGASGSRGCGSTPTSPPPFTRVRAALAPARSPSQTPSPFPSPDPLA
ncbi:hypothetical protein [Streptomyces sp. GC420]|uniref:hypothetical protein n=1 Tax=Streptomyces sp. GC420 TaxID=2697568 RepID=UPI0028BE8E71|nr:hypothetical protein [Streptomyces sp. GC420]